MRHHDGNSDCDALCCHLRVFPSNAILGLPETKLAIIPSAGRTYRVPRIVSQAHALDMILTGRQVGRGGGGDADGLVPPAGVVQ
jgi:hypothetical protein